jgi:hypothetical protein
MQMASMIKRAFVAAHESVRSTTRTSRCKLAIVRFRGEADMARAAETYRSDENDPQPTGQIEIPNRNSAVLSFTSKAREGQHWQ